MIQTNYNPDVLSCLANLSNDEVFTPPSLVNEVLDLLPAELWSNPNSKFLDPVSKSGVFLREMAKRLMKGMETLIPDKQERINHIFGQQLYGIAITDLTALLSRRSLYCSKTANGKYSICDTFDNEQGNIHYERMQHNWSNGKCTYCGASKDVYDREDALETHAYQFIHNEKFEILNDMKFDVIIGNPPYQLSDGGAGASAIPLYNKFVEQAKLLAPNYLTMIIPSRWFAGGRGLDGFRREMQSDRRIKTIVDYPKSRECFPGVDIAGGVCYFLWDRNYNGRCHFVSKIGGTENKSLRYLDEFEIVVRDNIGIGIIHKVLSRNEKMMSDCVLSVNPFGLRSYERGEQFQFQDAITLISSQGLGYIHLDAIRKNQDLIDHFKVCIGYLNPDRAGVNNATDGKINVTTKIRVLSPNEVVTETYIIPFTCSIPDTAINCAIYLSTMFARFMISLTLSSMHIAQKNFSFVPIQDFSRRWEDEELFEKYGLNDEEITLIKSTIRPMYVIDNMEEDE